MKDGKGGHDRMSGMGGRPIKRKVKKNDAEERRMHVKERKDYTLCNGDKQLQKRI